MMENSSVFNNPHSPNDNSSGKHFNMEEKSGGGYDNNPAILNIIDEGGENFYNYLKSLGLSKKSNLLVLSSKQHYFYDESDLRDVRTLVNLKRLNLIKNPEKFLHALFAYYLIMPIS